VIIGGGVGGASIAYHLTLLGWTDVVLVERADLASGTTFHSAGNIGQLRATATQTRMMARDGIGVFRRLREETGVDPGWHEVGSLRIASTTARAEELRRQADMALALGLDMALLTPKEAVERFPLMSADGIVAAGYLASDGWIDPSGLTLALIAGARARGASIHPQTRVTGVGLRGGHVSTVETNRGTVRTEHVVDAAGMFAPEVGRLVNLSIPIVAMEHQYLITEPIPGVEPTWPVVRDTDNLCYFRPETGGLLVGGFERNPVPWGVKGIPSDFNARLLAPDWGRFEEIMPGALRRLPVLADTGITNMVNGPDAFTPDGEFVLGETEVPGFWVAAGFCSHGIALAPAIGKQMACWIVEGQPEFDLSTMNVQRFGPAYRSSRYVSTRTVEVAGAYFALRAPGEERRAGRPLRTSPAYPRLQALGASFGEKAGWERPNWFDRNEPEGDQALRPPGLAGRNWSAAIDAEARATRATAGLYDMTSFTKAMVHGRGALGLLQRLCAKDVDRPSGSVIYTQLLNQRGGIECDLTLTRLANDRFLLVTGTGAGVHDLAWVRRHAGDAKGVTVDEVTSGRACFGLWGPMSRAILADLTQDDLSNAGFPYLTAREIVVGRVPVLAARVTNVGELGWELYPPTEFGLALWDTLWEAGVARGLVAAGYRAADALRLEKGYRAWPAEISPEDTPFEAGIGFGIRVDKPGGFIGRDALIGTDRRTVARRLRCLVINGPPVPIVGNEPVRLAGRVVGRVQSGGFGYTVRQTIAYAYLAQPEGAIGAKAEIGVLGDWLPATVASEPLYDPSGDRVRM
jgi:4-methylaminobutanoate oxidase (formaldehyde-forming)